MGIELEEQGRRQEEEQTGDLIRMERDTAVVADIPFLVGCGQQ